MPLGDAAYDVVWVQNVGMNIADKPRLCGEALLGPQAGRALRVPTGRRQGGRAQYFPQAWATKPRRPLSYPRFGPALGLEESGFIAEVFEDASAAELHRHSAGAAQVTLTPAVFAQNTGEKARNFGRNLEEGRIRLVRGVFRRPPSSTMTTPPGRI